MGNCCEPGHSQNLPSKTRARVKSLLKGAAITLDTDPTRWTGEIPIPCSSDEEERKQEASRRKTTSSFLQQAKTKLRFSHRKFQSCYKLIDILVQGGSADIFEVEHKVTKDIRVAKKINTSAVKARKLVENEIAILQELDHPNILKIHDYFEEGDHTILITDFIKGGNLLQAIVEEELEFSEREVAHVMKQLFSGLRYLHQRDILHCDIKPENILFEERDDQYYIKLIDFGVARDLATYEDQDVAGTVSRDQSQHGYMSPEHQLGMPEMKSDIWSAGVVLYILLTGEFPFEDQDGNPRALDCSTPAFENISKEAVALLEWIFNEDSWKRPNSKEVLQNQWFSLWKVEMNELEMESAQDSLNKLKTNSKRNELLRAVMLFLAMGIEVEDKNLRALFEKADEDNDGAINKSELVQGNYARIIIAYRKVGQSLQQASKNAQQIFNQFDINRKGFIDYTEYLASNLDIQELENYSRLKSCFDSLDTVRNSQSQFNKGYLTREEILRFAFPNDEQYQLRTPEWLKDTIEKVRGRIRQISYEDFESIVMNCKNEEVSLPEGAQVLWIQ